MNSFKQSKQQRTKLLLMFYVNMRGHGGDAIRSRETVAGFVNSGVDISVVGLNPKEKESFPIYPVCAPGQGGWLTASVWNTVGLLQGLRAYWEQKPQVIYADTAPGSLTPALLSRLTGVPLVLEVNTPVGGCDIALYRPSEWVRLKLVQWIEQFAFRQCRLVVAASGWADLVKERYAIAEERILRCPLAVNRELFYPQDRDVARRALGIPSDWRIAIFVGGLSPWQGLEMLVDVAPQVRCVCPKTHFLIVGDGLLRESLMRRVEKLGMSEAFTFTGEIAYERVPQYIVAADVGLALFPGKRGRKGGVSALKTLNYLACGKPVIVSEMDELAETIENMGVGKMIQADSPSDLADALVNWLDRSDSGQYLCILPQLLKVRIPDWESTTLFIVSNITQLFNLEKGGIK